VFSGRPLMKSRTTKTLSGSRKAKLPSFISPQLGTLVKEPLSGNNWRHELEFDGYTIQFSFCGSDALTEPGVVSILLLLLIGGEVLLVESEDKNLTALLALSALEK
jgi:hypothetical protein